MGTIDPAHRSRFLYTSALLSGALLWSVSSCSLGDGGYGFEGGTETGDDGGGASGGSDGGDDGGGDGGGDDGDDDGDGGCGEPGGPGGEVDFSNIWIANSPDGTISKIDTIEAEAIGRYQVTPVPAGSVLVGPSRTSVSLWGDMAVADRSGGLAKVYARLDDCVDLDNSGSIETATDRNALPYGEDECVAWRIDIPRMPDVWDDRRGPRAVQWTVPDGIEDCDFENAKVWVAFCNELDDDATVWLVNGIDGDVEVEIPITNFNCEMMGPYGGGIGPDNSFWFVENDTRKALYRAKYDCEPDGGETCWEVFARPDADMDPYGITVDPQGRVWMAGQYNSLYHYASEEGTWRNFKSELDTFFAEQAEAIGGSDGDLLRTNILRGLMMDENEVLWIAMVQNFSGGPYAGVLKVDTTTDPYTYAYYSKETLGNELQHAAGISIDVEGHVWLVDTFSNGAYKIDPDTPSQYTRVSGLNQPYTYSDMTGFGLKQVAFPPQG